MPHTQRPRAQLDEALVRLAQEHTVELPLDDLRDLLLEPDAAPSPTRRSPYRAGIDDLALTLAAAERLPDELTVRVMLPANTAPATPIEETSAAFRSRAADLADEAWREAMAIRSMGRRQLPLGITIGISSGVAAYLVGYLATVVDTQAVRVALLVVAMIALTVAWVVGWVVVEAAILDWRQAARRAAACELLESANVEVVYGDTPRGRSPARHTARTPPVPT